MDDPAFAPPPWRPDEALPRLQRELRALGLAERAGSFERRGLAVARVGVDAEGLHAAVVQKPSRNSPQWQARRLKDAAQARDFIADLKKKLALWSDRDD